MSFNRSKNRMEHMKAFWFAKENRTLCYGDNRQVVVGETHSVEGEIMLCKNGLHASGRLIDALKYAPGPILYHVELSGDMDVRGDKVAAQNRKYLEEFDATGVLRSFARKQALINIGLIKPYTDQYELIVGFLKTGDQSKAAAAKAAAEAAAAEAEVVWAALVAAKAAWAAAWSAAWAAEVSGVAKAAAEASVAARAAASWVAASCAASCAASWAAEAAAKAARAAANSMLTQMIKEKTGWDI